MSQPESRSTSGSPSRSMPRSWSRSRSPPRPGTARYNRRMLHTSVKDMLGVEFDDTVVDPDIKFPWTPDVRDAIKKRRAQRSDESLMIDHLMSARVSKEDFKYPLSDSSDLLEYIYRVTERDPSEEDASLYYLLLDMVHQGKETVSFQDRSNPAEQYAKSHFLSESTVNRTRGYWALDHDLIEEGIYHLCLPSDEPDRHFEKILFTLSDIGSFEASKWIIRYVDFVKPELDDPELLDAYVQALGQQDFARAWEWIRNCEFESHLADDSSDSGRHGFRSRARISSKRGRGSNTRQSSREERALIAADAIESTAEAERLSEITAQRERLLVVLLDKILKPLAMRRPLEALTTAPIDTFEEDILTAYLLDPETGLPQQSFDILHDLLTTRLLSQGRYSNAIDLDSRATELVRSSDREVANPRLKRERRQMVDDMTSLLPRVQRELLAAEKEFKDDAARDVSMGWATTSVTTSVTQTETATARTSVRASKRVVSLSGLISASPHRSGSATANLYQAILQNQANSVRAKEANSAPSSPAHKAHASTQEYRSPRPNVQPRAKSPFSSPVKLPRNIGSRLNAPAASSRPTFKSPLLSRSEAADEDEEMASVAEENEAESTPVPPPRQPARRPERSQSVARATSVEADVAMDVDEEAQVVDKAPRPVSPEPEQTPVKPKRTRKPAGDLGRSNGPSGPRYETRKRQASVAEDREESMEPTPVAELAPTPRPAKRARGKQAPSVEVVVGVQTKTPPRRPRKKTASNVPEEPEETHEVDPTPAAKRTRRAAATLSQQSVPPIVKRTARQTRSQSVMSEATTEGGDESSQARALRRSGRLSSAAPMSPEKSEAGGVRTRRAASRQLSEPPVKWEPARPRRTAARK